MKPDEGTESAESHADFSVTFQQFEIFVWLYFKGIKSIDISSLK